MKNTALSTLGFLMNYLDIQTVSMSQAIHVDASLVSKWKTGKRMFSGKSVYFDAVVEYILSQSQKSNHQLLKNALLQLYPHETVQETVDVESLLRQALTNTASHEASRQHQLLSDSTDAVSALIFEGNEGRRQAITKLIDYAEDMTVPGEIIFLDSEEYIWLLEDEAFSDQFTERIFSLLRRGFHAKFVLDYSSYRDRFMQLFSACSPLIFHRNVEWYYYEYYDEHIMNFSFFILNHAVSLLGLSVGGEDPSTMVFTDTSLVIRHEVLADRMIRQCSCVFTTFHPSEFEGVVNDIYQFRRKGAFYTYLPAPAFMSSRESLMREILTDNGISEAEIQQQLMVNNRFREVTSCHFLEGETQREPFVFIFQLEEMLRRIKKDIFISRSLTILNGKEIRITKRQYAQEIRDFVQDLMQYDNMQIVFVSEKDNIRLPSVNCWCKRNLWMVQMDQEGFRLSDEIGIVNSAAIALESCVKKVPPERKEKNSVRQFMLELADEMESDVNG